MLRTDYIKDAIAKLGSEVVLAGWVHEVRDMGKIKFIVLRDRTGTVQAVAKGEAAKLVSGVNREDVVQIKGTVVENTIAPNGVEISVSDISVLGKVEKKLPVDPTGSVHAELDTRLDYRYIDLRKPEVRDIFTLKAKLSGAFRNFLSSQGFVEIHPTCLVGAATEGGADVFEVQYFERKAYLAQSPQLYKQMAVVGGLDRVFMTVPVFRAEKHATTTHLNEISQMDVEMGFCNHIDAMDVLERTFLHLMDVASESDEVYRLRRDFEPPKKIEKKTYSEAIDLLRENNFQIEWGSDFNREAEKKLTDLFDDSACMIYEWPTELRAFYSMPKEGEEHICLAYDLLYDGLELSSGAQRIHIPSLLVDQLKKRGLDPAGFDFYIEAFRYGAPPHAGWSIGLERLTQKITGMRNIREVMLFPRDRHRLFP